MTFQERPTDRASPSCESVWLEQLPELARQREPLAQPEEIVRVRQATMLRSLVDGWDGMNADQRKRLLGSVSEGIVIQDGAVSEMTPKEGWRPFLRGALPSPRVLTGLTERKTGVKDTEVVTARLIQDERGWLQLAG